MPDETGISTKTPEELEAEKKIADEEAAKKAEEEAKAAEQAAAADAAKADKKKEPKGKKVVLKKFVSTLAMHHPLQKRSIPYGSEVELEMDTWTQAQVDAGILTEVE